MLILSHAISKILETDELAAALALNPFNTQARFQQLLDSGLADLEGAQRELTDNLASSVSDARNYSLLGTIARKQGRDAEAQALFSAALRLNPSEPNAAREQINADIAARRYDEALQRIAVYTRKGAPGAQDVGGRLVQVTQSDPLARAAVLEALAADPPWRGAFLDELQKSRETLELVPAALAALRASPRGPTDAEINGAVQAFLSAGDIASAYRLFVTSRDASAKKLVAFVYDAEFRARPSGNPFDWTIANSGAAEVRIPGSKEGGADITFLERPAAGFGLSQMLTLFPGNYRAALHLSATQLIAPDGVFVYVRCKSGRNIVKADIVPGTYTDRELEFQFEIPPSGCDMQTLGFATKQIFQHWSRLYSGALRIHSARVESVSE